MSFSNGDKTISSVQHLMEVNNIKLHWVDPDNGCTVKELNILPFYFPNYWYYNITPYFTDGIE